MPTSPNANPRDARRSGPVLISPLERESAPDLTAPAGSRWLGHWLFSGAVRAAALLPLLAAGSSIWPPLFADPSGRDAIPALAHILACFVLWLAGLLLSQRPRLAQQLAVASMATSGLLSLPSLRTSPAKTLLCASCAIIALFMLSQLPRKPPACAALHALAAQARGAALVLMVLIIYGLIHAPHASWLARLPLLWASGYSVVRGLHWAFVGRRSHSMRALALLLMNLLALALMLLGVAHPLAALYAMLLPGVSILWLVPNPSPALRALWELLVERPERLLVATFMLLCTLGTGLLSLPQSTTGGQSLKFLDALFTSVSAVCVTGLIVVDTPTAFSGLGQVLILVLIQVGGLGIMTFSTATAWVLGLRISMRHEQAVASLLNSEREGNLFAVTRRVLVVTFTSEAIGALLLLVAFLRHGEPLGQAGFKAIFTSVSAFCNAGFALQTESLIPYQREPLMLHTVGGLIILGGLSPAAICALPALLWRRPAAPPLNLQTRLILVTTAALLSVSFLLFLTLEWNHSLEGLPTWDRIHNAFFQAVTFRTAGFNSVDLTRLSPAAMSLSLILMFIGGSPGGTAGGIKTTTVTLLLLSVAQAMNGHTSQQIFGRRVSTRSLHQATVVTTVAALVFFLALSSIQLTQDMSTRLAVFEVVSALGTVGLSIGGTSQLDEVGKILLAACMFVGRVGGMALLLLVAQQQTPYTIQRPEEDVDAG